MFQLGILFGKYVYASCHKATVRWYVVFLRFFLSNIKNQLRLIMHNEITEILSTFLKVVLEEENKTFAPLGPHAAISVSD